MKKKIKLLSYILFALIFMLSFNFKVDAAMERECIWQIQTEEGISSTKIRFLSDARNVRSFILYYKGKQFKNPKTVQLKNHKDISERVINEKRCPPYALIIKQGIGYSVYAAFNEEYLTNVVNENKYKNTIIAPLVSDSAEGTLTDHNPTPGDDDINIVDPDKDNKDKDKNKGDKDKDSSKNTKNNDLCELELIDDLQKAWNLIQIAAPILVVLFGSIDFAQAVISQDNDIMKKAINKFTKRLICAVALFFLPLLINLAFELSGLDKTITNAVCGIK